MKQLIDFKIPRLGTLNYEYSDSKFIAAFDQENVYYKNIKLNKNTKLSNLSQLSLYKESSSTNTLPYIFSFPSTTICNYTLRSNWDAENSARNTTIDRHSAISAVLNKSYTNILDLILRNSNSSTLVSFEDSSNTKHYIQILIQEPSNISTYTYDVKILLLQANTLDNIAFSYSRTYPNTTHPLNTTYISTGVPTVFWVDTTNKYIYLHMHASYHGSSNSYTQYKTSSLYRISYTTLADGGSLSLGAYEYINIPVPTYYSAGYLQAENLFFCGFSNNGNPVYFRACERDGNTSPTSWYYSTETHYHRFIIVEHDLATNVVTVLHDFDSRNSWGAGPNINSSLNRITGYSSPTAFYQTSQGSDTYVCYTAGFDTTNNLRIVALFWNKATNVFQVKLLPLSNQATIKNEYQDTFDDSVPYVYSNANTTLNLSTKTLCPVILEIVKDETGVYYLSVYNELKSNRLANFCVTPATRNIVTFAISNNWETLTHVQTTPINAVLSLFSDLNKTNLFVAELNSFSIWKFDSINFWQKLQNYSNSYPYFLTKKNDNSVYVVDMSSDEFQLITTTQQPERKFIDVNVYEASVLSAGSNTINLIVNENLTYEGSPITSTIQVEVRDSASQRVSTDIVIEIHSSNCTFDDFSNIKTITTSDTDFVSVPILLNSPGLVYITSKFDI